MAIALALAVSGMYAAWGYNAFDFFGAGVLFAAGLAWPVFLGGLYVLSSADWRWARIYWGLWTMTVGTAVMAVGLCAATLLALAFTGLSVYPWWALLGGLWLADVAMGGLLVGYAPGVGITRPVALGLWVGGMNGFLVAVCGLAVLFERIA
ncbi:MAG: hypothetical protein AAGL98_11845 [Planctomycetota bacterium]